MNTSRDHRSGASWGMFACRAAAGLRPAVMCPIRIRPAAATCFGTRGAPRELAVADRLWLPAGYGSQLASSLLHVSSAEVLRALAGTPNDLARPILGSAHVADLKQMRQFCTRESDGRIGAMSSGSSRSI